MDLDSYIARYTGETRLRRLLSIAAAGPHRLHRQQKNDGGSGGGGSGGKSSTPCIELAQRQQALKLAELQMRRDGNASLYREIFGFGEDGVGRRIAAVDPKLFEGK